MSVLVETISSKINAPIKSSKVDSGLLLSVLNKINTELNYVKISSLESVSHMSSVIVEFYPVFNKAIDTLNVFLSSFKKNESNYSKLLDSHFVYVLKKNVSDNEKIISRLMATFKSIRELPIFSKISINDNRNFNVLINKISNENFSLLIDKFNDKFNDFNIKVKDSNHTLSVLLRDFENITSKDKKSFNYVNKAVVHEFFNDLINEFKTLIGLLGVYDSLKKGVLFCVKSFSSLNNIITSSLKQKSNLNEITKGLTPLMPVIKDFNKKDETVISSDRGFMSGFKKKLSFDENREIKERLLNSLNSAKTTKAINLDDLTKVKMDKPTKIFLDNLNAKIAQNKGKDFSKKLKQMNEELKKAGITGSKLEGKNLNEN